MPRQITIDDIMPDEFFRAVQMFCNGEYMKRSNEGVLPLLHNRYESYGLIAANIAAVNASASSVKSAAGMLLSTLAAPFEAYNDAVEEVFSQSLALASAALNTAIYAQTIAQQQLTARLGREENAAPLVDMIEEAEENSQTEDAE